jgi:hypothetical protein
MPIINVKTALGANGTANPLSGSQYEYLPFPAQVEIAVVADLTGVLATVSSGSDVLQEEGFVPFKTGTPTYPDDYLLTDLAAAGDRLKVALRETTGVAKTVYTSVKLTPL